MKDSLFQVVDPLASIFPEYHPDAADINEALDHGVASCAVRAYASALLLRDSFPNESLYVIDFGFSPEHGGDFHGANGKYLKMGHCVTRLWVPEQTPLIVESYNDGGIEIVEPNGSHFNFIWDNPNTGYLRYLTLANMDDIEVNSHEILHLLKSRIESQ